MVTAGALPAGAMMTHAATAAMSNSDRAAFAAMLPIGDESRAPPFRRRKAHLAASDGKLGADRQDFRVGRLAAPGRFTGSSE
jgi:hypothetical protein